MKSSQPHACWSVQSITRGDGRRAITLSRKLSGNGSQSSGAKAPGAGQREGGRKLRVRFANEKLSAFQVSVQLPATRPVETVPLGRPVWPCAHPARPRPGLRLWKAPCH
jgi:hypothetical protein